MKGIYKIEQYKSLNQFRIYSKDTNIFQSYKSTIAIIKNKKVTLGKDWDYSRTTLKYLRMFLEDYSDLTFNNRESTKIQIKRMITDKTIKYNERIN